MWKEVSELKDKKILIVGLGKTGVALAKFLTKHEAQVTVTDHKSKPELSSQLRSAWRDIIISSLNWGRTLRKLLSRRTW
jgi:UDP-N-acetylmuramoylalanine-D-glutamate ligase